MNPRAVLLCVAVWAAGCAAPGARGRAGAWSMRPDAGMAEFSAGAGDEAERPWIKHKVVPRERIDDLELRYGVSKKELIRWNKRLRDKQWIYAGQVLRIKARRVPPPREKITYTVKRRDRWAEIAKAHNIRESDLRYWNRKVPRAFKVGQRLTIYTNPLEVESVAEAGATGSDSTSTPDRLSVRGNALSVGKPNRGRIQNGVQLPQSEHYTLRDPERSYGSSHAVTVIHDAIAAFRAETGYRGEIKIADLSKKGGGRLRPHSSHQAGRDADIRLPRRKGVSKDNKSLSAIDWDLSWALVKAFVDSGEVEYIFLETSRQKSLRKAAQRAGASAAELKRAIQYPSKRGTNKGIVRHASGHRIHIHVRVKCAQSNSRCQSY
ncbi:MAG: penicillin-insensitive murein endopeptidase [Nannocystaceae bacterium]|nr:penicillin-insensitive murein endopeptidase [Nannocystaceae bacterium]